MQDEGQATDSDITNLCTIRNHNLNRITTSPRLYRSGSYVHFDANANTVSFVSTKAKESSTIMEPLDILRSWSGEEFGNPHLRKTI